MASIKTDIVGILKNQALFRHLPEKELGIIARDANEVRLEQGDILFQKGDIPTGYYLVIFGQLKLALPSPAGDEKVIRLLGPGHSFGEAVMFLEKPYPVSAQALSDTYLLHIAQNAIFKAIEQIPGLARRMLAGLSMQLQSLIQDVEAYSLHSAAQRLINYLLDLARNDGGPTQIQLPANKNIIASRLNLTPETFSRILHNLIEEKLINVSGRQIDILDSARLRTFNL